MLLYNAKVYANFFYYVQVWRKRKDDLMTKEVPARSFCSDRRVRAVLFFNKDGSIQEVNCYNQGEYYDRECHDKENIALQNIVFIVRIMLDGSVDYPYSSTEVVSRKSITTIELATQSVQFSTTRILVSSELISLDICKNANVEPNTHKAESASCDLCLYDYGTGQECYRICYDTSIG